MLNVKEKIKAVIFDMDGTIIKTEHIWRQITIQVLMEQCKITELSERHEDFLRMLSGMGLEGSSFAMKDTFKLSISTEELKKRKMELAEQMFNKHVDFIEGFQAFHNQLYLNQIPTSIATNSHAEGLKTHARSNNLELYFGENMYCIEDVDNKAKPDPALFLHAAKKLGAKPEECVVFEDSLYGFQAARAAGMKCVAIKNGVNVPHLDLVDYAIDDYFQAEIALSQITSI